ncbi:MAG: PEGA domain-containing protein [Chitinivibrionales bacterium]|nr:PEGA domain-containing protein [Chitinivibrionales bacterium]
MNVYGRLALLSPAPQVLQILQRAGIHNFIKVYSDATELLRASSEIIQQTTAINVKDIHAYAQKKEGYGYSTQGLPQEQSPNVHYQQPPEPVAPQYFGQTEAAYVQQAPMYAQPPAPPPVMPMQRRVEMPPMQQPQQQPIQHMPQQQGPYYGGPMPMQQQQQATFDPYAQQSMQGFEPTQPIEHTMHEQVLDMELQMQPQQQQKQPPKKGLKQASPFQQEEEIPVKKGFDKLMGGADTFVDDDDFFETKKSHAGFIILALIALTVIGIGAFVILKPFAFQSSVNQIIGTKEAAPTTQTPAIPPTAQTTPVTPAATTPAATTTPMGTEATPAPASSPTTPAVEPQRSVATDAGSTEPAAPRTTRKSRAIAASTEESIESAEPATPRSQRRSASGKGRIVITSLPPSALVTADGKVLGRTPVTWDEPEVYGSVPVSISKDGYETNNSTFEYTGGEMKKHFVLVKESSKGSPSATGGDLEEPSFTGTSGSSKSKASASSSSSFSDVEEPSFSSTPSSKPKASSSSTFSNVEEPSFSSTPSSKSSAKKTEPASSKSKSSDLTFDESSFESESFSETEAPPPTTKKSGESSRSSSSRQSSSSSSPSFSNTSSESSGGSIMSGAGETDALIFISSLPPMADVYLNGQKIGKTNVVELRIPPGTHTLKFVKGDKEVTKQITVIAGKNPSQLIRLK